MLCKNSVIQILDELRRARETFREQSRCGVFGIEDARLYAHRIRNYFNEYFQDSQDVTSWAVVGVGGLGRGEMSFFSDIDVLFLYSRKLKKDFHELIRELAYWLWDAGFDIGHNTVSVASALRLAFSDFSILTSHLTSYHLAGSSDVYYKWKIALMDRYKSMRAKRSFLRRLKRHIAERHTQFGDSAYVLEPNIKEGPGGLRDIHALYWTAAVFWGNFSLSAIPQEYLPDDERSWIIEAEDFLWRVRICLHKIAGKRQDRLLLVEQKKVSELWWKSHGSAYMHSTPEDEHSSIELFMQQLYRHTARAKRVLSFFVERAEASVTPQYRYRTSKPKIIDKEFIVEDGHIRFLDPNSIPKNPALLMKLFAITVRGRFHFHHETGKIIRMNLGNINDRVRTDPKCVQYFFEVLTNTKYGFNALDTMLETGLLGQFIPEFSQVRYRVQYDVYHIYTVDEHLLRTVRELYDLAFQYKVMEEDKKILFLAGLLHDIGKGEGKGHSIKGAKMVREIGARMGLAPTEIDELEFLVEHHLLLAETALKRDLEDEKPIAYCATIIGNVRRFTMLYLLTIADSLATGPRAWNTWKATLMSDLYNKLQRFLTRKDWHADTAVRIKETKNKVLELCRSSVREDVSRWLDNLSHRYVISQPPERIISHFFMEQEVKAGRDVVFDARMSVYPMSSEGGITGECEEHEEDEPYKSYDMWDLTVVTTDRPGLFSMVTGVLWAHGINVLSADIYSRSNGIAVDIITINDIADPMNPDRIFAAVERDLKMVLNKRDYLDKLIYSRRTSPFMKPVFIPRYSDRVVIDEDSSDFFTVIEVYTWDRPGVLYAITDELYRLGVFIRLAKISTPGAQVADIFYVTNSEGRKLYDEEMYRKIEHNIISRLVTLS